jgi:hypothetical protein
MSRRFAVVVVVRTVALDVHTRFAEVAIHENGALRRLGRIETSQLGVFAQSLGPGDHVVLESTAMTDGGHEKIPTGGHRNSPLADMSSPR